MDRREYLITTASIGAIALAGCTGSSGGSSPKYETDSTEELLLSTDAFPEGWTRDDSVNDNFNAVFLSEDETIVVLLELDVHSNVENARSAYDNSKSGFRDPQEMDFANEAFWDTRNEELAYTIFRASNAIGGAASGRESGMELVPDQGRSQQYAQDMYQSWQ